MKIQTVVNRLRKSTRSLDFAAPVTHVYAPLDYASQAVDLYLEKYARKGVEALFLGMNPGPWGMAQTGIPFGEVDHVRRFLHIDCAVGRPKSEHPRRPVEGFQCQRSEVSGMRVKEYRWPVDTVDIATHIRCLGLLMAVARSFRRTTLRNHTTRLC